MINTPCESDFDIIIPQCTTCKHLRDTFSDDGGNTCEAFPDGIPLQILRNELDHRKPIAGDNGIQYEALKGTE